TYPTCFSPISPQHPLLTPFPYTTLFRSLVRIIRRPPRLGRVLARRAVHVVESLGARVVRLEVFVGERPRGRDAAVVANLAEVGRSEEHTSELQSLRHLVCRLLLEKKKKK